MLKDDADDAEDVVVVAGPIPGGGPILEGVGGVARNGRFQAFVGAAGDDEGFILETAVASVLQEMVTK
jgi:hypothetical protein